MVRYAVVNGCSDMCGARACRRSCPWAMNPGVACSLRCVCDRLRLTLACAITIVVKQHWKSWEVRCDVRTSEPQTLIFLKNCDLTSLSWDHTRRIIVRLTDEFEYVHVENNESDLQSPDGMAGDRCGRRREVNLFVWGWDIRSMFTEGSIGHTVLDVIVKMCERYSSPQNPYVMFERCKLWKA